MVKKKAQLLFVIIIFSGIEAKRKVGDTSAKTFPESVTDRQGPGTPDEQTSTSVDGLLPRDQDLSRDLAANRSTVSEAGVPDDFETSFDYGGLELTQLTNGRYNCSPPHEIPSAWRCDLVRQCDGGEDEEDFHCHYNGDCEKGSVTFDDNCLRFQFPLHPISPAEAGRRCKHPYHYKLLSPQDPELMQLVLRVTSLNGHEEVIVDVSRVKAVVPGTEHLYRFLWQWGVSGHGSSHLVIYGQPDPRADDLRLECGILRTKPHLHLQPVSCSQEQHSPFVCSSTHQQPATRRRLQLSRANQVPDKFPTNQCSDGSYTHVFHSCPRHVVMPEVSDASDSLSQSEPGIPDTMKDIPKFECRNGALVDYSLTCDAHDDCGDGTDEEKCDDVALLSDASFKCQRTPEVIASEDVCDGIPHCHDGTDEEGCIECKTGTVLCDWVGCLPLNYSTLGNLCPRAENGNEGIPDPKHEPMNFLLSRPQGVRIDMDG
ncbi:hypothetical protein BaRGS_00034625, partial [Batillaria attramentaria]